jgi:hypothetical protein
MPIDRSTRLRVSAAGMVAVWLLALVPVALGAGPATNTFTSAILNFKPDSGSADTVVKTVQDQLHFPPANLLYFFCWPPSGGETDAGATGTLDVGTDGAMTGSCTAAKTTTAAGLQSNAIARQSSLTGTYFVAQQLVNLRLEGRQTWTTTRIGKCDFGCAPYTFTSTIAVEATDVRVEGDRASGTARYTYQCAITAGTGDCASTITQVIGTVDFTLDFQPPLASGAPAAAGSGAGGSGGDSIVDTLEGLGPLLLLLLLVLLATSLLFRRVLRTPSLRSKDGVAVLQAGADAMDLMAAGLEPGDVPGSTANPSSPASRMQDGVDTAAGIMGSGDPSTGPMPSAPGAPTAAPAPVGPPATASPATPPAKPSSAEPGHEKPPELVMTENIVLAAELADPEKPPPNPADL